MTMGAGPDARTINITTAPRVLVVGAASVREVPPHRIRPTSLRAGFVALTIVLLAYAIWLLGWPNAQSFLVNDWGVDAFEFVASCICLYRARTRDERGGVALLLGGALMCWTLGDIVLSVESLGNATIADPSFADIFYVAFYPLCYLALVRFLQRRERRVTLASWLDGAAAGLGAAAICAALSFHSLVHLTGSGVLGTAVNLTYPVGDLLLLALAIGGTVIMPSESGRSWLLIGAACSINAIGDTFNLLQSTSIVGTFFNSVAWATATLLMAIAVWIPTRANEPVAHERPPSFAFPVVAAITALAILAIGTVHELSRVSIGLAAATLVITGARLGRSAYSLRILTEERERQAHTDELTGLANRRQLFSVLDDIAARHARDGADAPELAFLYVDLDNFKVVNDSFGHAVGDQLLRDLGPRLDLALRESDLLVRIGGDEFAVVLVDADAAYALTVAQRIVAELARPFELDAVTAHVAASIGIATIPGDASTSADLVRRADVAMYRAKVSGTAVEVYDREIDDDGNQVGLVGELREAIVHDLFEVHFQPQLDLRSATIVGAEALLRWRHERLGQLPPLKFIPLAEQAGLMPALTTLVLEHALRQCASWRHQGLEMTISVNVSATNLLDSGFVEVVQCLLHAHAIPAGALVLEITETTVISDYARLKSSVQTLRDLGIIVSIDDFGAGITALAYLSDLAVGELKLDRTFITGLAEANQQLDLVRSTIQLGHALHMRVVAEGVEDETTLGLLAELGCDLAQGYFISRPMLAEDLDLESASSRTSTLDARQIEIGASFARQNA